jgi:D-3-phosphoglycerate dehydrogenase / 2-oxoglutarate reductase
MANVLITALTLKNCDGPYLQLLRGAGYEVRFPDPWDHQLTEVETLAAMNDVDAVLAGSEPYTAHVLANASRLKVIARNGVGYDAVDIAEATRLGIAVTITPGANHDCVAEHCFALLLSLAKNVVIAHKGLEQGNWLRHVTLPLRRQTLGLVGLGRIGKAVALRAKAFGMKVIVHELQPDRDFIAQQDIEVVPLETLFRQADVVSLHAPMTLQTRHLINAQTLALMKPTALLVNTARGGLVDELALADALRNGRLAGAALDVFADEPLPPGHPFTRLNNVVLTPHTAGTDLQSRQDMALMAAQSIMAILKGEWPAAQMVNPQVLERLRK